MSKYLCRYALLGTIAVLTSCSTTHQLSINTMAPAQVDLSHSIKRIGIINSSLPEERAEYKNRLGQMLLLEDQELSKQGPDAAINGLFQELVSDSRFDTILLLEDVPEVMKGMHSTLGNSSSWETIEKLCKAHNVDLFFLWPIMIRTPKFPLKKPKWSNAT